MTKTVMGLLLLLSSFAIACGGSDRSPPQAPGGYPKSGGGFGATTPAAPAAPPAAEAYVLAGANEESRSPSMAGGYAPPADRPMRDSMKREADRDSDGIPDSADRSGAPAPAAPPPPPPAPGQPQMQPPKGAQAKANDGDAAKASARDQSMLVYTANLNLAVYLVEQAIDQVEQIARDNGGFLASRGDNAITIRVPRSKFQGALAAIEKTGDVLHRDVKAIDVTDEFTDLEIRIKNARAMRDQLAALLAKANVKESIEIERELGRVTEELERMEGQLKLLKDKIAYSTITVTYAARGSTIQQASVRLPFPWLSQLGLPGLLRLEDNK